MTHIVEAIYDHGVFRPVQPLALAEGARVRLHVEDENKTGGTSEHADNEGPSLFERLKDVVGSIDDLPEDSSENLDHYLYGHPKQ
jgi:predicted DNA-binding antitoxin AbrB/MazE fold protein